MLSHIERLNARLASLEAKASLERQESVRERPGLGEGVPVRGEGYDFEEDTMEQFVGKTIGERLAWLEQNGISKENFTLPLAK